MTTLRTIHLHGALKQFSAEPFDLAVNDVRDVMSGCKSRFKSFKKYVIDNPEMVIVLTDKDAENPRPVHPEFLVSPFIKCEEVHLFPATEGAGIETALATSLILSGTSVAVGTFIAAVVVNIATGLIIGAITAMLSPQTESSSDSSSARPDQRPSFLFNGAENVVEQGYQVPVVYGTHMTGSVVVSAGISVEQIPLAAAQSAAPANGGGAVQPAPPPPVSWQYYGNGEAGA